VHKAGDGWPYSFPESDVSGIPLLDFLRSPLLQTSLACLNNALQCQTSQTKVTESWTFIAAFQNEAKGAQKEETEAAEGTDLIFLVGGRDPTVAIEASKTDFLKKASNLSVLICLCLFLTLAVVG